MDTVDVYYFNTKAGTYVQFELPVHTRELGELNAYDQVFQKSIRDDFKMLFDTYGMDFASETSYIVPAGEDAKLVICLLGKTSPELEATLARIGVRRGTVEE